MALPTVVIRDSEDVLALYVPTGTIAKDNYAVSPEHRVEAVDRALPSRSRVHVDRRWEAPSIRLYLPGQSFSVWLFFTPQGDFISWYGNLEAPYLRTDFGIDTRDHALDVVADASGRWRWKDEAEFARRLTVGIDSPTHQTAVRAAGQEFISRFERGAAPFDGGWQFWRAPPEWLPRQLPPNWSADFGTHSKLA